MTSAKEENTRIQTSQSSHRADPQRICEFNKKSVNKKNPQRSESTMMTTNQTTQIIKWQTNRLSRWQIMRHHARTDNANDVQHVTNQTRNIKLINCMNFKKQTNHAYKSVHIS